MVRFMVSGVEEAAGREVASRLRGAIIETGEAFEAAVFVGPRQPEGEVIGRFLAAGKHVLVAAESCPSSAVLEALAAAARQGGVQLAVVNPDHYLPSRQLIRQQLDAGKLGEVGLVRAHRWEPAADNRAELLGVPGPLTRDIELVCWLAAKQPNLVYAVGQAANGFVQVHLGFPGGSMALLDYFDHLAAGDGYQSVTVIGSTGAAYANDHQNMQLLYRGGRPQAVRTEEGARQMAALVQEFVDGLRTGRDLSPSVTAWRNAAAVAGAVRRSLESRCAVSLEGR